MHINPIIDKPENRLVKRFVSIEGVEFEDLTTVDSQTESNDFIPVTKIEITPSKIERLLVGESVAVSAKVYPANATYADNIIWKVPLGGVAYAVEYRGTTSHVKAMKAGYSRLIAEALNTDAEKQPDSNMIVGTYISVYSQDPSTVSDEVVVSKKSLHISSGEYYTLSAEIVHAGESRPATSKEVSFESSNKKVATVGQGGSTKGRVVGVSTGIAVITVWITDNPSKKDTCTVYVNGGGNDPIPQPDPGPQPKPQPQPKPEPDVKPVLHVYSVSLSQANLNLREKENITLIASVTDNGVTHTALQNEIIWKTSDRKVATVTSFGKVTAGKLGECEIRAYLKVDSSVYATCKVIVEQSNAEDESHGGSTSPVVVLQNCLSFLLQKVKSTFSILVRRNFSSISSTIIKKSGKLSFTTRRASPKLQCTIGLVCGVSIGTTFGKEVLWVSDGMLLTVDGGNFYVEKE